MIVKPHFTNLSLSHHGGVGLILILSTEPEFNRDIYSRVKINLYLSWQLSLNPGWGRFIMYFPLGVRYSEGKFNINWYLWLNVWVYKMYELVDKTNNQMLQTWYLVIVVMGWFWFYVHNVNLTHIQQSLAVYLSL